jgi:hypothetical protein
MEDTAMPTGMNGSGPLTVVVSWKVKPGKEAAFEEWHRGISAAALTFPGHLGVTVIRPSQTTGEHIVIFKFDTLEHLAAWQESALRREWLARAGSLQIQKPRYQTGYGLEFWFASPKGAQHPPRWKMALITVLAIYPTVNLVNISLKPLIGGLSPWLAGLVAIPIIVLLMTYVVMPFMTRVFAGWLFPAAKEVQ